MDTRGRKSRKAEAKSCTYNVTPSESSVLPPQQCKAGDVGFINDVLKTINVNIVFME